MKALRFFLLLFVLLINISVFAQQPTFNWMFGLDASQSSSLDDIAFDPAGNLVVIGNYLDTLDVDPGPGVTQMFSALGTSFVAKYDASGNYLWAEDFEYSSNTAIDASYAVACSGTGDIYVVGTYDYNMDLDPGPGSVPVSTLGTNAVFLVKLDVNGNFIWGHSFESPNGLDVADVTTDNTGAVYFCGSFSDSVDFDPGPAVYNLYAYPTTFSYITKLDANGNFVWAHAQGGGYTNDLALKVLTDNNDNLYMTGYFNGTMDVEPGPGITNLSTPSNSPNIYIQKFTPGGALIWAGSISTNGPQYGRDMTIDDQNNIVVSAEYTELTDVDMGPGTSYINTLVSPNVDAYAAKYDSSGALLWVTTLNDTAQYVERCYEVTFDSQGSLFMTGIFHNTIDFDPGPGVVNVSTDTANPSVADTYILKLDVNRNFEWVGVIESTYGPVYTQAMEAGPNDQIYFVGGVSDTADMDPNSGVVNLISPPFTGIPYMLCLNNGLSTNISHNPVVDMMGVQLYPNPSKDKVTIDLGKVYNRTELVLTDVNGKLIQQQQLDAADTYRLQLPESPGVYFVHLKVDGFRKVLKVVKE